MGWRRSQESCVQRSASEAASEPELLLLARSLSSGEAALSGADWWIYAWWSASASNAPTTGLLGSLRTSTVGR